MNKHIVLRLTNVVVLLSVLMIMITCKKDDPSVKSKVPTALTLTPSWIGRGWATIKGQVNGNGNLTTVFFQYDTTATYAYTISPVPDTTSNTINVTFSVTLTGLKPKTKYHFRTNAINTIGSATGPDVTFTTTDTTDIIINFNPDLTYDSIYDSEGTKYKTIQIGTQTWMAENLRSTKLNDGTEIPFVTEISPWSLLTGPGYCWFNNDSVGYGAIYNWYTVNTLKLCPAGWHVPSDAEWTTLSDYLGGRSVAGGLLKEAGTKHWLSPNNGGTNGSGFTGLPTGYRYFAGGFNSMKSYAYWWSSTETEPGEAYYRASYYSYASLDRSSSNKNSGMTVRCVKD
jgi:uncharacterized protein (TIGR02145 family)